MFRYFSDSPEYIRRKNTPFTPTHLTIRQIRAAIPKELFEKSTIKGLAYVALDVIFAFVLYKLAWQIDALTFSYAPPKWSLWSAYWFVQSIVLAGWWCMAHEAGHGNISEHKWINHVVGFSLHTVCTEYML
jgi:fatty acid desaturase